MEKGLQKGVYISLCSLMENLKIDLHEAMKLLNVPESEYEHYAKWWNHEKLCMTAFICIIYFMEDINDEDKIISSCEIYSRIIMEFIAFGKKKLHEGVLWVNWQSLIFQLAGRLIHHWKSSFGPFLYSSYIYKMFFVYFSHCNIPSNGR